MPDPKPCMGHPSQHAAVAALLADHLTNRQIADRTGLKMTRVQTLAWEVRRRQQREGVVLPPAAPLTVEARTKIARLVEATMGYIAEAMGVRLVDVAGVAAVWATTQERLAGVVPATSEPPVEPEAQPHVPAEEPPPAPQEGPAEEPSREDDEATLAVLAAEEGHDDDEEPSEESPPASGRATPAGLEVRLRSRDGQFLHQNGRVLTRHPRFIWWGSAAEASTLKRRNKLARDLVEIPS